jgi:heptosyltransferase I
MIELSKAKILIVLLGAIGDVTRGLSLAVRIKKNFPSATIHWAVEPKSKQILQENSGIDEIKVFDRPRGLLGYLDFIKGLRAERYDLVLDLQRHLKSGATSFLTGAEIRVGFNRKNAKEFNWLFNNRHIPAVANFSAKIEHYQMFGDLLGLPANKSGKLLDFGFIDDDQAKNKIAEQLKSQAASIGIDNFVSKKTVALILGSSWLSRLWPVQYYIDLILLLKKKYNLNCVLVGGPAESNYAKQIKEGCAVPVVDFVAKTSLRELVELFRLCAFAFGPDSGPMHIAAAAGCRVISIWGATSALRSAPYRNEDLLVESALGCAACYQRRCPGLDNLCMKEITPSVVEHKMSKLLMNR